MLGSCFLKFTRLLSLTLPIIDPSLYIHRFASKLEFGDKTHLVSMSALRLVQRMKRDWIQTGRRPSGICGAALLIASRVHGFRRTQREVVRVVRICDVTLRRRLVEFSETPMGALTARQLETVDIEAFPAADPPSYTRNRREETTALARLTMSEEEKVRLEREAEVRSLRVPALRERLLELEPEEARTALRDEVLLLKKDELVQRVLEYEQPARQATAADADAKAEGTAGGAGLMGPPPPPADNLENEVRRVLRDPDLLQLEGPATAGVTGAAAREATGAATSEGAAAGGGASAGGASGGAPSAASTADDEPGWTSSAWYKADLLASRDEAEYGGEDQKEEMIAELNDDLEKFDDEIDCYIIRDEEEVQLKTRVWEEMNREYLEAQAEKKAAREDLEENQAARAAETGEDGAVDRPRKKRGRKEAGAQGAAAGEEREARRQMPSSRINYEVVQILSKGMEEDALDMPSGPGPIGSLAGVAPTALPAGTAVRGPRSVDGGSVAGSTAGGVDAFSETLSVHSGHGADAEPRY